MLAHPLAKVALVAVIFAALAGSGRLSLDQFRSLRGASGAWALGLALVAACYLLAALRLNLLLRALKAQVTWLQCVRWTMIGSFWDILMPVSIGGDLVKAYYCVEASPRLTYGRSLVLLLFDRLAGLVGLITCAGITFVSGFAWWGEPAVMALGAVVVPSCLALLLVVGLALVPGAEGWWGVRQVLARLWSWRTLRGHLLLAGRLRRRWGLCLGALLVSTLIQLLSCAALLAFAASLAMSFDPLKGLLFLPAALVFNAFGFAGGMGVGELAFEGVFSLLQAEKGAALAVVYHLAVIVVSATGLPFYLTTGKPRDLAEAVATAGGTK